MKSVTVLLTALAAVSLSAADVVSSNSCRMAVVDFRPFGNQYEWCGRKGSTVEWVKSLGDKLNIRMVRAGHFTMLDRKFIAEVNDELAVLSEQNSDPADVVRKCRKLATDYLVVGEVKFFPVRAPAVNPVTGQVVPTGSQLFAEVTYRILHAPTGRLRFADCVKIDAASFSAGTIGAFESMSSDAASSLIMDGIRANCLFREEKTDGAPSATGPVVTPVAPAPATPLNTTVQGAANGGVVTPF